MSCAAQWIGPDGKRGCEVDFKGKATRINLFNFATIPMRTFHVTWFAFFLCFFAWFGIAPLMAVVREDLSLTKEQLGNTIIASVAITVVARLITGWLLDKIGPRKAHTWLLVTGSIPVMTIGLADSYETFLLFRLAIGAIGASFVITQYHTSVMFAPNTIGTANATTAGWGNLGGGVTQIVMPLIFAGMMTFVAEEAAGWRLAMVIPGIALLLSGFLYWKFTEDSPDGSYAELRAKGELEGPNEVNGAFLKACADYRVWALFIIYGACFGVELTINNIAALYFHDYFKLGLANAGLVAGLFGLMNIFARTLGGIAGDKWGLKWGLQGRVWLLGDDSLLRGNRADGLLAANGAAERDRDAASVQPLRADVLGRHLLGRALYQQEGARGRGWHCRRGRQRGRGRRGLLVQDGSVELAASAADLGRHRHGVFVSGVRRTVLQRR